MSCPILVVDDEQPIRDLVAAIVREDGHEPVPAHNGAEALRILDDGLSPKLIILDMRMPVMDGWTFARALVERGLKIPILVMTAAQNAGQWASEIHADGFIAKPFDIDDITQKVHRFCG